MKVIINSKSSGKFTERTINGRPHLVTSMVSIEGDTVMNRLFYPNTAVTASYQQLNDLPAPAAHPTIDGRHVSATHPLATNAFNVGAFVMAPQLDGMKVVNELAIDLDVANKDERGVEIVRRIKNSERIGVSTGLNATMAPTNGEHNGEPYDGVVSNLAFDHVAILLDEMPAGKSTYTQNSEQIMICNMDADESVNELRDAIAEAARKRFGQDRYAWVADILLNPDQAVIEIEGDKMLSIPFGFDDNQNIVFTGEGVEVKRRVGFEPVNNAEANDVDLKQLLAYLSANAAFSLNAKDVNRLADMSEADLAEAIANSAQPVVTEEAARETLAELGLTVNSADFDAEGYAEFQANAEAFKAFKDEQEIKRTEVIEQIVANSDMEADDLADMDDAKLAKLANSFKPAQDYSGAAPAVHLSNREGGTDEGVVYG